MVFISLSKEGFASQGNGSGDLSLVQLMEKISPKQIIKMYLIMDFTFNFSAEKLNKISLLMK